MTAVELDRGLLRSYPGSFATYEATRDRIISVALDASDGELGARVPSCPEWTAHDLVAHCAGIPTALTAGAGPTGDIQAWLDALALDLRPCSRV